MSTDPTFRPLPDGPRPTRREDWRPAFGVPVGVTHGGLVAGLLRLARDACADLLATHDDCGCAYCPACDRGEFTPAVRDTLTAAGWAAGLASSHLEYGVFEVPPGLPADDLPAALRWLADRLAALPAAYAREEKAERHLVVLCGGDLPGFDPADDADAADAATVVAADAG